MRRRRSRRRVRRLSVPNPHEGAHPAHRDGTSEGSASRSQPGRQRPPANLRSACQGDRKRRSSRPGSTWGVVKRAMHLHASFTGRAPRRAKACRARTKRRKTFSAAGRDSIDSSTKVDRCWVPVSAVSVADAGRTHLWSCGSDRESGSGGVEMLKRGVESAWDRLDVRGLVASPLSSVFDARRRKWGATKGCAGFRRSRGHSRGREFTMERASAVSCDTVEGVSVQKP